ncbi:histidine kinase [Arthrobacter crystallopoietes]|nr:histidine kinase [Arthrobacter crystallopoietes]
MEPGLRFTAPREYARLLRTAHEQVIGGVHRPEIPAALVDSWRRSMALGIDPDQHSPRRLHDTADVAELRRGHRLQATLPALTDLLAEDGTEGRHLLIITDAQGEVLWRIGSASVLCRADSLEFIEGADWSEAGIGTNAISQALTTGAPVQLFSAEHLVRTHHEWACTAAPIRDPRTGHVLGVLDVSGPLDTLTADSLRMVRCGVRVAEELLAKHDDGARAAASAAPERRKTSRGVATARSSEGVRLELLGDKPAAVLADGSQVPLTLRRAEILALMDSRSQGWSADELAFELYGDTGTPSTVRIEMHRIRAALGDVVASSPYRLTGLAERGSDARQVMELLRQGKVREALDAYSAPLLTRSSLLCVELLREELNLAVGAAVRTSGSAELISRWLATDMGSSDAGAVDALERLLGPSHPRCSAFRARIDLLDRTLRN